MTVPPIVVVVNVVEHIDWEALSSIRLFNPKSPQQPLNKNSIEETPVAINSYVKHNAGVGVGVGVGVRVGVRVGVGVGVGVGNPQL